ncbi:hypothetical protein PtrSN002B_001485 [Pyrenophora tritici-repentis]|uniref:Herpes-BLLF1 multi-domain protein n=1 Tax=Pyrenophora tritici-repentis TaxID=45151 RepID=A0A922NLE2_9PLEO|nr:hypothetical protein Ptr86124_003146 [Pyrenophora tritici-repentis]KAI1546825.1 hypothetical protein PtrSN001A_001844 [Pyrenophora tritici-repentis]KAI1557208.1 hypothetical protein PtrSN002B_001485 [Pyrenophora tritici-repentis]
MSNCSLVAPGLPSLVGGAIPTFAYDHAEHGFLSGDDFGIEMAYMSGTSTCFHSEMATLTPILSNPRLYYTRTCQYVTIGTTYTALECPKGRLWDWVNRGEYIIDNKLASPYSGQTPRPFTATFGNSAAPPVSITTSLTLTRPFTTTKSGNYYPFSPVTITRTTATSTSTSLSTVTVPVTVPVVITDCPSLSNLPLPTSTPETSIPQSSSYPVIPPLVSTSTSKSTSPFSLPPTSTSSPSLPTSLSTIPVSIPTISTVTISLPTTTSTSISSGYSTSFLSIPVPLPTSTLTIPVSILTSILSTPSTMSTSIPVSTPSVTPTLSRDHASDPIIELILDPGIVELKLKLCYVYLGSAIIKLIIGLIKHIIELNIKLILKLILKLCYVYLSSAIIELILDPDILKLKPCCVYLGSAIVFSILDHVSCRQRN